MASALRTATGVLVATDLVGGLLAVGSGLNTWGEAWGGAALLAAPVPMVLAQVALTWGATRSASRWAATWAVLLALACGVSVASGFFDGGLGHDGMQPWQRGYQGYLLLVTGVVGLLAAHRAAVVLRGGPARPARPGPGAAARTAARP